MFLFFITVSNASSFLTNTLSGRRLLCHLLAFSLTPVGQHLYGLGAFGSGFNLNDSLDGMFEVQFVLFVELLTLSLFDLARLVV